MKSSSTRFLIVVTLACVLAFAGCGTISQPVSLPTGNWLMTTRVAGAAASTGSLGASLQQNGSNLTGVLHSISFSRCSTPRMPAIQTQTNIPVTGWIQGSSVHLTSNSVYGQVITIDAQYNGSALSGSYQVQGGCADGEQGVLSGRPVTNLSGTWTGTTVAGTRVTVNWQQQSSPTVDGVFSLGGTATISNGPDCYPSGTLKLQQGYSEAGAPVSSFVTGNALSVAGADTSGPHHVALALAGLAHSRGITHSITGTLTLSGVGCGFHPQQFVLTRQ